MLSAILFEEILEELAMPALPDLLAEYKKQFKLFKSIITTAHSSRSTDKSLFSMISYLINHDISDKEIEVGLKNLNKLYILLKKNNILQTTLTEEDLIELKYFNTSLIFYFSSNTSFDTNIKCFGKFLRSSKQQEIEFKKLKLQVNTFQKKDKSTEITGTDEQLNEVHISLTGDCADAYSYLYENCIINLINIKQKDELTYLSTNDTLLVLEPAYLVDVSELAKFYSYSRDMVPMISMEKYFDFIPNYNVIRGNAINIAFDKYVNSGTYNPKEVFEELYRTKPLQVLYALESSNITWRDFQSDLESKRLLFDDLHLNDEYKNYLEPTYISFELGLSGRLDLLQINKFTKNKKKVVELKSGKAPNNEIVMLNSRKNKFFSGVWESHFAQICCYYLLIDANTNSKLEANLFYTGTQITFNSKDKPTRGVTVDVQNKKDVIKFRNYMVSYEYSLINGFNLILNADFGKLFASNYNTFLNFYSGLSEVARDYFNEFSVFIAKDNVNTKLQIYKRSANEAKSQLSQDQNFEIAQIILEECDFEKLYLTFELSTNQNIFRIGDQVIISTFDLDQNDNVEQVFKGSIKEITYNKMLVTFRNKYLTEEDFTNNEYYIYQDASNRNAAHQYKAIYNALSSPKANTLLGLAKPRTNKTLASEIKLLQYKILNQKQAEIVEMAILAKDYYLIQGPPGTGKTSYVLRHLVKYYYEKTTINILLVAFTNRAVDEICKAVLEEVGEDNLIRLGNKESSELNNIMLALQMENISYKEFKVKLKNVRIFAATTAYLQNNYELFLNKKFDLAIIDEASQLNELSTIGICSKVDKFILIGDEKQLPAISTMPESEAIVVSEKLKDIGIEKLNVSLFERLLRQAKKNNWTDSFGMLVEQSRMHTDIMFLANELFYQNKLKKYANVRESIELDIYNDELSSVLAQSRVIFINSQISPKAKINSNELKISLNILKQIKENITKNKVTIGVIAPFKKHCIELQAELEKVEIFDVSVDTVERYQGSERDIILINFVCSNLYMLSNSSSTTEIDGIEIDRKLNVAITRAKEQLIMVGNLELLKQSSIHKNMIRIIEKHGLIIEGSDLK